MGLEYIQQPQVFLSPITAVGGIQNGLNNSPLPPLYTSFYTWTSTSSVTATTFPLDGIETLTNRSGSYIVTVGGVVQAPTNYTVDPNTRNLTFDFNVNADTPVVVTQIGTIATSALNITDLTATNSLFNSVTAVNSVFQNVNANSLLVTNLTALTAEFQVIDIVQYELSGFNVQGDANIAGNANVTGTVSASNVTATNISLLENGTLFGTTSSTFISVGVLSAREIDLIHTPANDGVDPILDIGETTTTGFSGFRVRYDENNNRLLVQTLVAGTSSNSVIIDRTTGQVGISAIPNQALTVTGNISATNNIQAENLSKYFILSADLAARAIASTTPFFDTTTLLNLASGKNYKINYDLYLANNTAAAGALRFILSASDVLNYINVNYVTTNTTGISGATNTPQMGSMFAPTTGFVVLPSFAYSASTFQNTLIQATIQTNNPCSFNIAMSGNATNVAGSIIPKRGSSRVVQLME